METQTNLNCSLSNTFVQHPQSLFTSAETRIYHAALLCLHKETADLSSTYTIYLKDLFNKSGNNYAAMHLAIASLLARRWFNEPLFLRLEYFRREGAIELEFNPALVEHLLGLDEYYTCLPVASLQAAGLVNPLAWRLLWLLRSFYRGYSKAKKLSNAELEELVWNNQRESTGYSRLKQAINAAVASLQAAGLVDTTATTNKRGLVAKGIDFTIPTVHPSTSPAAGDKAIIAVEESINSALFVKQEIVEPVTIAANVTEDVTKSIELTDSLKPELRQRVEVAKEKMRKFGVTEKQIEIFATALYANLALEKAFFSTLYLVYNKIVNPGASDSAITNKAAFCVSKMQDALNIK